MLTINGLLVYSSLTEHGAGHVQVWRACVSGTRPRQPVFAAVKATAEVEFGDHQWVRVQHHDEPQVYVHLCVKTESMDGQRLNPRKADQQRWRGVGAEAARRASRLQREKDNKPWGVAQMEGRGVASNPAPAKPDSGKAEGWREVEKQVADYYDRIVDALRGSEDASDRTLASELNRAVQDRIHGNRSTDRDRRGRERHSERG